MFVRQQAKRLMDRHINNHNVCNTASLVQNEQKHQYTWYLWHGLMGEATDDTEF